MKIHIFNIAFVRVGTFYLADEPWTGTDKKHGDWIVKAKCKFVDERALNADENVYFVTVDDEIVYVGEYIYNLGDRWFKNSNGYVNHHVWEKIDAALESNCEVSLWLCYDPYMKLPDGSELNIAKSLEQKIIDEKRPRWNKRNNRSRWDTWRQENCIRIKDIFGV